MRTDVVNVSLLNVQCIRVFRRRFLDQRSMAKAFEVTVSLDRATSSDDGTAHAPGHSIPFGPSHVHVCACFVVLSSLVSHYFPNRGTYMQSHNALSVVSRGCPLCDFSRLQRSYGFSRLGGVVRCLRSCSTPVLAVDQSGYLVPEQATACHRGGIVDCQGSLHVDCWLDR